MDVDTDDPVNQEQVSIVSNRSKSSSISEISVPNSFQSSQFTLSEILNKRASFDSGGSRNIAITNAQIYMICRDNIPTRSNGNNLKHVYNDHVNTDITRISANCTFLLATKVWISSDRQRQCAYEWTIQKRI
ncbi:PREDICTED: uncharacterized protein LOC105154789 [Acromyrmex echinatior]|uniref:uncharacterized protein LOC105154789 n=1 Tax=Acromyrmex echinatior TaxID=103372 RepID=UPI000580E4C4|nr:PREDICTED: uncharacterized protein LOC105154789 [Acromyrmex echinatior]